jgi:Skp family chaperone for outer membrane proteins
MSSSRRGFLSGGLALAGGLGAAEQGAPSALRIGIVNVRSCFDKDKSTRMAEGLEELGKLRDQWTKEAADLQKNITGFADLMERLERGGERNGDLYVEKLRLRAHAEYDLKLLQEVARRKLRDRVGDLEARVNADLRRVVAQVARSQNLDLVLRVDEPRLPSDDPEAAPRTALREVLYQKDALDLTPQVVAQLNAEWAKAWLCAACKRKATGEKCPDCGAKKP